MRVPTVSCLARCLFVLLTFRSTRVGCCSRKPRDLIVVTFNTRTDTYIRTTHHITDMGDQDEAVDYEYRKILVIGAKKSGKTSILSTAGQSLNTHTGTELNSSTIRPNDQANRDATLFCLLVRRLTSHLYHCEQSWVA